MVPLVAVQQVKQYGSTIVAIQQVKHYGSTSSSPAGKTIWFHYSSNPDR